MSKFFRNPFSRKMANVSIQRDFYTMATVNGDEAEIQFYGEIVKTRPIDWWTGEPEPGNFIMLDEFLEDLKSLNNAKSITMRIDSLGGDSDASVTIHNRLRELKAHKTAIVDGVAMSGGSLIMSAADTVKVNPSSQVMIHKCWSYLWGAYNADELRDTAREFDAVDKQQVAIYKRKTGLDDNELLSMMSDTTFLVGQEILDKGFADELLDADGEKLEIAASADKRLLFVNGRPLHMAPSAKLPKNIPMVETAAQADDTNKTQPATTGTQEGGTLMAKNLEELRNENPELANQLMSEAKAAASTDTRTAVEAERKRIEEIDSISSLYDDETVKEAKYGKTACTAQELAFRVAQNAAKKGKDTLDKMQDDFNASGAGEVPAAPAVGEENKPLTPEQRMAQGRADAKKIQKKEDK